MTPLPTQSKPTMGRKEVTCEQWLEVNYQYSPALPDILNHLNASILVSTYQAGKVLVIGVHEKRLRVSFLDFDQPMGIAVDPNRIAIGTRRQICFLRAARELATRIPPAGSHDGCWAARQNHFTGSVQGHDLAWGREGLWIVNTLFSCLCTLDEDHSFVPRWKPPFITKLIDQDRCHLNGLAMRGQDPAFVTVLAVSDEPAGWRPVKAMGGCVLDVATGEAVARQLAMPHSPRWYDERLWVLNSGHGTLSTVDLASGVLTDVQSLPGYTRGLGFAGQFAFVGLSKIRETNIFGGLPIGVRASELCCGVAVVDLVSGRTVATFQFDNGVEEIFSVELLQGCRNPAVFGLADNKNDVTDDVWIVPPEGSRPFVGSEPEIPPITVEDAVGLIRAGTAAHDRGDPQEALSCFRAALQKTSSPSLLTQLGNLLQDMGHLPAAMASYQEALELCPKHCASQRNLGVIYASLNQPQRALEHFELAQQASPHPMNLVLAANVLPVIYGSSDQVNYWRKRMSACFHELIQSNVIIDTTDSIIPTSFCLAYQGLNDRAVMQDLANVYRGVRCCQSAREMHWKPRGKRIRVGFVSAYFCNHTIGRLNLGMIQHLSRSDFEVTVIALQKHSDGRSTEFRKAADHYVEVSRHPEVARNMIAGLGLDVLIFADVGMDCLSQTLSYSRMASIQAVTWGHPDTTGSPEIDYFISSDLAEPLGADDHYSESLVRLPTLGIYYEHTTLTGTRRDRSHFGLPPDRRVYLCPQTLFKFHPDYDDVLNRILTADPGGDLVVIESSKPAWNESLLHRWQQTLPEAEQRVRFLPSQSRADFLHLLSAADVVLDPFPFCGGNSSYEALAVGAPVVTLPGEFLRGRLTFAMYQRMQMTLPVARTRAEYVDLALRIANEDSFSQQIKQGISQTRSVLFENHQDIRAYQNMLHSWCSTTSRVT